MYDDPRLWPQLPSHPVDEAEVDRYAPPGSEFRAAWEFKLSHKLTPGEGSAFWHGVNIQRTADLAREREASA